MGYDPTVLLSGAEYRFVQALAEVLRTDPVLSAYGLNVWDWDMVKDTLQEPKPEDVPLAILDRGQGTMERAAARYFYKETFTLAMRLYVPGLDKKEPSNLWYTMMMAMLPTDPGRQAQVAAILAPAGELLCNGPVMTATATGDVILGSDKAAQKTVCSINAYLYMGL